MSRRYSLLGSLSPSSGGEYILKPGPCEDISIHTYLYNKYGSCGTDYNPIQIDEEIYLEGFGDYTGLNGKATYLCITPYSDGIASVWLYTDESITKFYVANIFLDINENRLIISSHFYD